MTNVNLKTKTWETVGMMSTMLTAQRKAQMDINLDNLSLYSIEDLSEAKKAIDKELTNHLERIAVVMGLPIPKKRIKRNARTQNGQGNNK